MKRRSFLAALSAAPLLGIVLPRLPAVAEASPSLEASFREIMEVAIEPGGVSLEWVTVDPLPGFVARYAVRAAVNDGSYRSAGLFIDVPADGGEPSRITVPADDLIVIG